MEKGGFLGHAGAGAMTRYRTLLLISSIWGLCGCAGLSRTTASLDPLSPQEHVTLGNSYLSHGEKGPAIQQYQMALDEDRHYAPALIALGNAAYDAHDWQSSRTYFRRALKALPGNVAVMNNLAMADVTECKDLDHAQHLIDQALPNAGTLAPYLLDTQAQITRCRSAKN